MLMTRIRRSTQVNKIISVQPQQYTTIRIKFNIMQRTLHTLYWKTNRNPMNALKYFSKSGSFYSTFTYIMAIRN